MVFYLYNIIYKLNDLVIYSFLIIKLIEVIKEYKYVVNKFYLERVMYNHYYNKIINNCSNLNNLKIDKYYYFKKNYKYINEKDFIKDKLY